MRARGGREAEQSFDWERLRRALGVTRVAKVSGLDRGGVEVACAIRPGGHVLQVTNGKGEEFERAAHGAVLEAAELWAAERVDPAQLVWGSLEELGASGFEAWGPEALGSAGRLVAPELWSPGTRLAWRAGTELFDGGEVLVPAQALHCPPAGSASLGPALVAWSSNGMGAHPVPEAALAHALLEAVERDQLSRALPEGWTRAEVEGRLLEPEVLAQVAPRAARLVGALARRELQAWLFDLDPKEGTLGLPVAGALLVDGRGGPVPLTAGYACGLEPQEALLGALLEAAQSRLTDIHGARDDVAAADRSEAQTLAAWCARASGRSARRMAPGRAPRSPAARLRLLLGKLRRAGMERAVAVELAPEWLGVSVIKAVVPGLQVSELL